MDAASNNSPITLPVASLRTSTPFYLALLKPLGYRSISRVQHTTNTASSTAVGIGPGDGTKVQIFLSQSDNNSGPTKLRAQNLLLFLAASSIEVREAYTAAVYAGGQPITSPRQQADGSFAATVLDADGNRVGIASKTKYRRSAKDASSANLVFSGPAVVKELVSKSQHTASTAEIVKDLSDRSTARLSGESVNQKSSGGDNDPKDSTNIGGTNAIVGSLLGAAAGAALTYAVIKSKDDSRKAEQDEDAAAAETLQVQSETRPDTRRAIVMVDNEKHQPKGNPSGRRNEGAVERDSGYYSSESARDPVPKVIRHGTWPEAALRGSGRTCRQIQYVQTLPLNRSSSSHQQMEPSAKLARGPPRPPSPPLPYSVERRTQRGERIGESSVSLSDPTATNRARRTPPTASQPSSHSRNQTTNKPNNVIRLNESVRQDPSNASRAGARPSSKRYSVIISKSSPKNTSNTPSQSLPYRSSSSRVSQSTNSNARRTPLPLPITQTELSAPEAPQPPVEIDRSILDELETVVPDDSISCAPSPPRSVESRSSHISNKRSLRSSRRGSGHAHIRRLD